MKAPTISLRSDLASRTYRDMSKSMALPSGVELSLGEILPANWQVNGFQSGLEVTQDGDTINLSWVDGSSNEDSILIERSMDRINFVGLAVVAPNTTSYIDNVEGITSEYIYYRITAIKGHSYNRSDILKWTNTNASPSDGEVLSNEQDEMLTTNESDESLTLNEI